MTYQKFIKELKEKRKLNNLRQQEIATILCMTQSKYSKIENGSTEPSFSELISICRLLDISLDAYIKSGSTYNNFKYD